MKSEITALLRARKKWEEKLSGALVKYFAEQRRRISSGFSIDWTYETGELERAIKPYLVGAASEAAGLASDQVDPALSNAALLKKVDAHAGKIAKQITENTRKAVERAKETQLPRKDITFDDILETILGSTRAGLIGVTEIVGAWSEGQVATLAEVVEGRWQWHTARDELVCPICFPLNDEVREIGDGFVDDPVQGFIEFPPAHPNCRCIITPYLKGG